MKLSKIAVLFMMALSLSFSAFAQDSTKAADAMKAPKKHHMGKKGGDMGGEMKGEKSTKKSGKKGKKSAKKADADATSAKPADQQ